MYITRSRSEIPIVNFSIKPGGHRLTYRRGVIYKDYDIEPGVNYLDDPANFVSVHSITDQILDPTIPYVGPEFINDAWTGDPPYKNVDHVHVRHFPWADPTSHSEYHDIYYDDYATIDGYPKSCHLGYWARDIRLVADTYQLVRKPEDLRDEIFGTNLDLVIPFMKNEMLTDDSFLGFSDAFNVLLFIAELKDLRTLPKLLTSWTGGDKVISDKYLGYNFGVVPVFSDVKSIWNRLANLGPAIDRWNEMADKGETLNIHRNFPLPSSISGHPNFRLEGSAAVLEGDTGLVTHNNGPIYGTYITSVGHGQYTASQRIKAKAHVYFRPHRIPDELISELKRRIWGFNRPLGALWEGIPFSFVIDWFVDIGKLIDQFEQSEPLLSMTMVAAGISLKVETVAVHQTSLSLSNEPGRIINTGGNVVQDTRYYRQSIDASQILEADKQYSALEFKTINATQATLGSALLHQMLRK